MCTRPGSRKPKRTRKKRAPQRAPHGHAHPPHPPRIPTREPRATLQTSRHARSSPRRQHAAPPSPRTSSDFDLVFFPPRALPATVTRPPSPTPPSGSAPSAGSALVCSRHDHCVTPATRRPRGLGLSVVCRVTSTALRAHSARVRALPLGLAPCRCRPGCASLHA